MKVDEPAGPLARSIASLPFFVPGLWLGAFTAQHLWRWYSHRLWYSFGFNFNFGLVRLREPWASWLVLTCCASLLWAGWSVARRGGGWGVIVGAVCVIVCLLGLAGAL